MTDLQGKPLESRHYSAAEITTLIDFNAQRAIDVARKSAIIGTTISVAISTHEHHIAPWAGCTAWQISRVAWLCSARRRGLCEEHGAEAVERIEQAMGVVP